MCVCGLHIWSSRLYAADWVVDGDWLRGREGEMMCERGIKSLGVINFKFHGKLFWSAGYFSWCLLIGGLFGCETPLVDCVCG